MKLANRVAIITGAAQGIGAACARVFAEQGAKVVIGDVNEVGAAALAKEIAAAGGYALARRADVGVRADCEALVELAVDAVRSPRRPGEQRRHRARRRFPRPGRGRLRSRAAHQPEGRVSLRAGRRAPDGGAGAAAGRQPRRHHQPVERERGAGHCQPGALHRQQGRAQSADEGDGPVAGAARHPRDGDRTRVRSRPRC